MAEPLALAGTQPKITIEQAATAFNEVAAAARAMSRLTALLNCFDDENDDPRDRDAFLKALENLANHAGLIADRSAGALGGMVAYGTEPEDWLMPPSWHDAAGRAEGGKHG